MLPSASAYSKPSHPMGSSSNNGSGCSPSPSFPSFRRTSGASGTVGCLAASASSTHGTGAAHVDPKELHVLLLRQRVSNMFRRYVPTKLHRLDIALLRYHGREDALLRSLVAKFGPEPAFSSEQQQLSDALSDSIAHAAAIAERRRHHRTMGDHGMRPDSPPVQPPHPDISNHHRQQKHHQYEVPQSAEGSGRGLFPDATGYSATRRCRTTSPRPEQFPAAVALVAHHHQLRSRLFEAYTAKRSIVRMQEEKERESLARLVAFEFRHLMSQLSRRQTEALLLAQREKTVMVESMLAQRRQEEAKAAWLQAQSAQLLIKAHAKKEETHTAERAERRVLARHYADERVRLFRHERRLSKLRDVAEDEARRAMLLGCDGDSQGGPGGRSANGTPVSHRQRLEDAIVMGESGTVSLLGIRENYSNGRRHPGAPPEGHAHAAVHSTGVPQPQHRTPAEFSLFSDLGTTVAYSVGGPPTLGGNGGGGGGSGRMQRDATAAADFPTVRQPLPQRLVDRNASHMREVCSPKVMVEVPMLPSIRKPTKRRGSRSKGKGTAATHHASPRDHGE